MSTAHADDASTALHARYRALQSELGQNQFGKPIHLDSVETPKSVAGDIYAVLDHPFAKVSAGLSTADSWCDILILHVNTKFCRASTAKRELSST